MAEFLITLCVSGLVAVGLLYKIKSVLDWIDTRNADRLSEEWRRRVRERRVREAQDDDGRGAA